MKVLELNEKKPRVEKETVQEMRRIIQDEMCCCISFEGIIREARFALEGKRC